MVQLLRVSFFLLLGVSVVLGQSQDFLGATSTTGRRMDSREAEKERVATGPSDMKKESNSTALASTDSGSGGGGGLISMEDGCSVGSMFVIIGCCIGGICYQVKSASGDPRQLASSTSVVPTDDAVVVGHAPTKATGSPGAPRNGADPLPGQTPGAAAAAQTAPAPAAGVDVVVGKPIRAGFSVQASVRAAVAQGAPHGGEQQGQST